MLLHPLILLSEPLSAGKFLEGQFWSQSSPREVSPLLCDRSWRMEQSRGQFHKRRTLCPLLGPHKASMNGRLALDDGS